MTTEAIEEEMTKPKSKIPVRRPLSEDRSTYSVRKTTQSELYKASSDLSNTINILDDNDDSNYIHSVDVAEANAPVRSFILTIQDSKGEFVKQKKSYKLIYDKDNDGGDEYRIEKESILTDFIDNSGNETQEDLTDVVLSVSRNATFDNTGNVQAQESIQTEWLQTSNTISPSLNLQPDVFSQKSKSAITESTSLPVFDDTSTVSQIPAGDTYILDNATSMNTLSPISGHTIRLLTPQDRNETNILFKPIYRRNIATVKRTVQVPTSVQKELSVNSMTSDTQFNVNSSSESTERTSNSLPSANFKANLFNRVRRISTPRHTPKFSPTVDATRKAKVLGNATPVDEMRKDYTTKETTKTTLKCELGEETFIKDSSIKRFERVTSSESVRSHYDKKLKQGQDHQGLKLTGHINDGYESGNVNTEMFALKAKRHRRTLETSHNGTLSGKEAILRNLNQQSSQYRTLVTSGLTTNSAILNKPVLKQSMKSKHIQSQGKSLLSENSLNSSINDMYTEEDETSKLRQAQFITQDLKIVKTKLKDSCFVAQHLDSKIKQHMQKKSVLSNLNKNKTLTGNTSLENLPTSQCTPVVDHPNLHKQIRTINLDKQSLTTKQTECSNDRRNPMLKMHTLNNVVSPNLQSESKARPESTRTHTTWRLQPKIHRFNSDKVKQHRRYLNSHATNEQPNQRNNVATWLLHSARGATVRNNRQVHFFPNRIMPPKSRRKSTQRLKSMHENTNNIRRKESNSSLKTQETKENIINAGKYMPIGKTSIKRKHRRFRPRLYTQLGKVKGYEVCTK